jgi:hypothetical protein
MSLFIGIVVGAIAAIGVSTLVCILKNKRGKQKRKLKLFILWGLMPYYNAVVCVCTVQYSTGQYRTGQYRTGQDRTGQCSTGQDSTGQYKTGQYGTVLPMHYISTYHIIIGRIRRGQI